MIFVRFVGIWFIGRPIILSRILLFGFRRGFLCGKLRFLCAELGKLCGERSKIRGGGCGSCLQRCLASLQCCLKFGQGSLLIDQRRFLHGDLFLKRLKFFQHFPVITADILDKICFVQKIGHRFRREKHFQKCCISGFVHILDTGFHIFVLFCFVCLCGCERFLCTEDFSVGDLYLHLSGGDLIADADHFLIESA